MPRTVELSEFVQQDIPLGWLVFTPNGPGDYRIFYDQIEAQTVADEIADANDDEESWPVYPLWAGDPLDK